MKQPEWIKQGIALGNEYHYRKKNPFIHNGLNLAVAAALLGAIVLLLCSSLVLHPVVYVFGGGFAMGTCFFALYILVIHEASHNMFIVTKKRERAKFWNRLFGWAVAIPFATNYIKHWEEGHHTHHIHPVEPDDPQTVNLLVGKPFLKTFLMMLFVPGYVFLWNPSRKYKEGKWIPFANLAFWAVAIAVTVTLLPWWSALAFLGAFNTMGALNQLKGSLEHGGDIAKEANRNLRSRTTFLPFRWMLLPMNISLHFEHHLNYCVPWYELLRYHRALRPLVPAEVQPLLFNEDVWSQIMGRLGKYPPELRPLVDA